MDIELLHLRGPLRSFQNNFLHFARRTGILANIESFFRSSRIRPKAERDGIPVDSCLVCRMHFESNVERNDTVIIVQLSPDCASAGLGTLSWPEFEKLLMA